MAFLYLTEQGAVLRKVGRRLVVVKDDQKLLDIPAGKIEGVLIFGNVQFTTQALRLLFEQGIEMAILSRRGKLLGQLTSPNTKNIILRQAQYAKSLDPEFVLSFAKSVVAGKLRNCLQFLREFRHNHPELDIGEETDRIETLMCQTDVKKDSASLLGLEGAAGRAYFQAFRQMVRGAMNFDGRRRHPSPDPVNALLSFGYTLVYTEIGSLLDGIGFDPYLGYYHQPSYGHATLASDLLEEFRSPLVDRFTLALINNRIFDEEDFFVHTGSGGLYLKDEPRKRYFVEYERFVTRPMADPNGNAQTWFRKQFRTQAERLRDAVNSKNVYIPYEFSW